VGGRAGAAVDEDERRAHALDLVGDVGVTDANPDH
jgi:hypothetical protein